LRPFILSRHVLGGFGLDGFLDGAFDLGTIFLSGPGNTFLVKFLVFNPESGPTNLFQIGAAGFAVASAAS
jgi:hypothetical protein|tara:strand:+ start:2308 stop:2517 length:210 start_codon:yes stop_codon:yes gene_type:complete